MRWIIVFCALVDLGLSEPAHAQSRGRLRVACVGDSLTYGKGLRSRTDQAYPTVLGRILGAGSQVKNFGANGTTVLRCSNRPYWDQQKLSTACAFAPSKVVLLFGSNDSKQTHWNPRQFHDDLSALVERFRTLPSRPQIVLCTPTPVFRDRWGVRGVTVREEVIPQIRRVARAKNLRVIDLHSLFRNQPERFPDGIHPDARAAAMMAGAVQHVLAP